MSVALALWIAGCGGSERAADAAGAAEESEHTAREGAGAVRSVSAERADVESIDAIIPALYGSISFEPGAGPDWDRMRTLFHPDGRLVPPRDPETGELPVLTVEEFVESSSSFIASSGLQERGFYEVELARELERFGNMAHAWSAYASHYRDSEDEPFSRGINSIQLLHDGDRWWLLHIVWDSERQENPLPLKDGKFEGRSSK